jgi:hypothetical protein
MNLCEVILLSENVNFPIEKVNILPNKLYQKKFDNKLVMKLTKNLFGHSLFETVNIQYLFLAQANLKIYFVYFNNYQDNSSECD